MPLSEHEQRLLEQIERELYADDPKLVSTVRSINPRTYAIRRLWRSAALFIVGLAVLVAAVVVDAGATSIALGLVGFVVMLLAALRGSSDLRRLSGRPDPEARIRHHPRSRGRRPRRSITERAQERWQRRWDDRDR
jgi:hypothetical protein